MYLIIANFFLLRCYCLNGGGRKKCVNLSSKFNDCQRNWNDFDNKNNLIIISTAFFTQIRWVVGFSCTFSHCVFSFATMFSIKLTDIAHAHFYDTTHNTTHSFMHSRSFSLSCSLVPDDVSNTQGDLFCVLAYFHPYDTNTYTVMHIHRHDVSRASMSNPFVSHI